LAPVLHIKKAEMVYVIEIKEDNEIEDPSNINIIG
jgi:hypothetical protein